MTAFLIVVACFAFCFLIERVYYCYLDTLPKDIKEDLLKKQTEMRCTGCGSKDFEVIGKNRRIRFQCKHCSKIHQ